VTVLVASQVKGIVQKISLLGAFSSVILFLLNLLPYVSIWALFVLLYLIMPNTRVPLRSGIVGGVAAGTIYQLVQWFYIKFQIGAANYGAIYGSFAALPLFLVWLQLSWTIVLFGAEIAYADEHRETFGFHPDYSRLSSDSRKVLMLRIFHFLVKKFSKGEIPPNLRELAHTLEIPFRLARRLLSEMAEVELVVEIAMDKTNEIAFQPGRSIDQMTIQQVLEAYELRGERQLSQTPSEEAEKISGYLKQIRETIEKSPANVKVKEI
jgi:membrane protein